MNIFIRLMIIFDFHLIIIHNAVVKQNYKKIPLTCGFTVITRSTLERFLHLTATFDCFI